MSYGLEYGFLYGEAAASNPTRIDTQDILNATILTGDLADLAVTPAKANLALTWDFGSGTLAYKTPTSASEVATKWYVDQLNSFRDAKNSVKVVAMSNVALSGLQTIDGYALQAGDRVLLVGQTDATKNGIYDVSSGAWSRSSDANSSYKLNSGMYTFATEGTVNYGIGWLLQTGDPVILDSTPLTFTQFTALGKVTAGTAITKSGHTLSLNVGSGFKIVNDKIVADEDMLLTFPYFVSEIPSGSIDGANSTFKLSKFALSDSAKYRVYKRGLRMTEGDDYVLSSSVQNGNEEVYIVFQPGSIPTPNSNLTVDYFGWT